MYFYVLLEKTKASVSSIIRTHSIRNLNSTWFERSIVYGTTSVWPTCLG